ncbi:MULTISPECIES: AbrB/MazE/SpoVT family DNA-binding domain-containing protein [Caballeronia]|jgi:antitoxin MazE|uniref:Antitoxin n=1 Tax=Caballeronia zhejiangensis TaxID=871203 RepID=A0A656QHN9_9BURK|nr:MULTISPECIES: AbrB/MazE/SpoVT family DNA-binding domain-containing protein [Caballeronia]EKS67158.1 transcriptional regulator/antitoxin, MazE [Burkholderia sp. SJ98]KDR30306.1 antitoxin [Caballeronia zhejiangensis]MDR5769216.1 AbrB/MazE/SpoVT family DNA-binding domain-containing protein [Caballeronia sp. LZ028]MDR5789560.1 AbrB/MazE/SpoVT family DNA-binding domain-containing protein [Caballeronia sp. LP003]MDR5797966.1 AbrB/MazE/SpoVT family DNA-binding domain-containing protein [Caballeron
MRTTIRKMGNSQGILIPKPLLAQLGLENEVDMEVENDAIVLRRPRDKARQGWAEASKLIAQSGEDGLVMGEFGNDDDGELEW